MKQAQDAWDDFSDIRVFKGETKKAKAHLKLNLCEDVEGNKGFFKYINNRKNTKGYVGPIFNGTVTVATEAAEKAEISFLLQSSLPRPSFRT